MLLLGEVITLVTVTPIPSNDIKLNSISNKALTITFSGYGTLTDKQDGSLNVTAKVTYVNVTLTGNNLLGAQDVTVTNNNATDLTLKLIEKENAHLQYMNQLVPFIFP